MKELTEPELRNKAEVYCSAAERCPSEIERKLADWGASGESISRIIRHLTHERYLDTARYCKAFVRDKYRFTHWGRIKIAQALRMKGLSSEDIALGMEEIDEDEYHEILSRLLLQKRKDIKGKNEYERNTKLIRFAIGRGFSMDEVLRHIKSADDEYSC